MNGVENFNPLKRGKKLERLEINIDEKWPVFTLDKPRDGNGPFVVDLNEDFYNEYLYFSYKYLEYQARIQVIYEHQQSEFNNQNVGHRFPKDSVIDTESIKLNVIRPIDAAEAKV